MQYIAHFSFEKDEAELGSPTHGCFTCVAEAADVDEALDTFHDLLGSLKASDDVLDGIGDIYLDSCAQIARFPEKGFLAHFVEWDGEVSSSISTSLRGVEGGEVSAFTLGGDDAEDSDGDEAYEAEPFMSFDS